MSKTWIVCPPVASPEAAEYDAADRSDLGPEDLEPAVWETDPALLAELDAEMQQQAEEWVCCEMCGHPLDRHGRQLGSMWLCSDCVTEAEEWALLAAQMEAPAVGTLNDDEPPY